MMVTVKMAFITRKTFIFRFLSYSALCVKFEVGLIERSIIIANGDHLYGS